jgi:alkylation response protein AidB-like acyl-CoA dehydrogenase
MTTTVDAAPDIALVRRRWGDYLERVSAGAAERDVAAEPIPASMLAEAGPNGLQAYALPVGIGGEGADALAWGQVLEHVGYLCEDVALPLLLSIRTTIAQMLARSGPAELVERYAVPIARGRLGVATCFTEDADVFAMRTVLRRDQRGDLRLTGLKSYVSGAMQAEVFLTYALDESSDMVAVLVHRTDPGVTVTPVDAIGHRSSGAASVGYDGVRLPADRLIVAHDGLAHAQSFLNERRLYICCAPVGRCQRILELCVGHVTSTVRYGQPLADMQNVQATIGRMYAAIEASRAVLHSALRRVAGGDADLLFDPVVSAAKYVVAEQVRYVLDQAFRIMGGQAYYGDPRYGRYQRDFAGLIAAAGTQDVLEVNLGAIVVATALRPTDRIPAASRR